MPTRRESSQPMIIPNQIGYGRFRRRLRLGFIYRLILVTRSVFALNRG